MGEGSKFIVQAVELIGFMETGALLEVFHSRGKLKGIGICTFSEGDGKALLSEVRRRLVYSPQEAPMLLEQLVEKAAQPPEYDWDAYYTWMFSCLTGREITGFTSWICKKCLTVNIIGLPARYGKCRGCSLIYLPTEASNEEQP